MKQEYILCFQDKMFVIVETDNNNGCDDRYNAYLQAIEHNAKK